MQNFSAALKVKIKHNSKNSCSIYIYIPWSYNDLTFTLNGSYSSFDLDNTLLTNEPTTDKESTYYDLNNPTLWNGLQNDSSTLNTSDTHVPVFNGTKMQYRVIPAGTPAVPKTVYSNASGTSGTVTLSANTANYKNIKITYKNDDNQHNTTTLSCIDTAQGSLFGTIIRKDSDNECIMINCALFNVTGTTITISRNSQANIYFGGSSDNDTNKLYITKVELWN